MPAGVYERTPEMIENMRKAARKREEGMSLEVKKERMLKGSENARLSWIGYTEEDYKARCKAVSEGVQKSWDRRTPEENTKFCEAVSRGRAGQALGPQSEVHRRHIGEGVAAFLAKLSPEGRRQRIRESCGSEEARRAAQRSLSKKPNKCEKMLWKFLEQSFSGMFSPHWEYLKRIGKRYPDFWTWGGHKVVVETMGPSYHGIEEEEGRVSEYKLEGWICVVVWAGTPDDIIAEWPSLHQRLKAALEGRIS